MARRKAASSMRAVAELVSDTGKGKNHASPTDRRVALRRWSIRWLDARRIFP